MFAIFSCISSLPFNGNQEYLMTPSVIRVSKDGESMEAMVEEAMKIMDAGYNLPFIYDPCCYWNWCMLIAPIEDDKSPVFRYESDWALLTARKVSRNRSY
jgi:hypothetical protein